MIHIPQNLLDSLGILDWGYTEESVPHSFDHFENWTQLSADGLNYLTDHRKDLRKDLKKIYPEFESALVFLFSYEEEKKYLIENKIFDVAAYSVGFDGIDYHYEIVRRLKIVFDELNIKDSEFKISLDVHPVLERDLAFRAGLGWFGKNSMIISREFGSYFLIGSILLNTKLNHPSKSSNPDHCGTCTLCIDSCPTSAIDPVTRTLNAKKCISTFTIEVMTNEDPPQGFENSRGEIFGCDICQDVCPWNKKRLKTVGELKSLTNRSMQFITWLRRDPQVIIEELENMSKRGVKKFFEHTVFERPGKVGWIKNFIAKQKLKRRDLP